MKTQSWPQWTRWTMDQALDLHERLKRKVRTTVPASFSAGAALLAVVLRHVPQQVGKRVVCSCCNDGHGDSEGYPCGEARLIADCMDVPPEDGVPPRRT